MRRSQSTENSTLTPVRLIKSRSEAVIRPGTGGGGGGKSNRENRPELLSPINSDDEDEEDEMEEDEQYEDAKSVQEEEKPSTRTPSVIFNTTTAGLEKLSSNSIININNIVNINNTDAGPSSTSINNKNRAESYPLTEIAMLKKELLDQKKGMDKLKKQNQLLVDENTAMKKLLETTGEHPKLAPQSSANIAVVKVGYLIKRGLTWHNWCSRWCVLRWGTLTYFRSPSDTKPKGLFHLQGCEVEEYL